MAVEVVMPQMGESVVEGTITGWLVKEGDQVAEDQPLVAISTDKVDTEIPSPAAGVIARIVAKEGETLPIGALLAVIETAPAKPAAPAAPVEAAQPSVEERAPQAAAPPGPAVAPAAPGGDGRAVPRPAPEPGAPRYSPLVARMAAEHGIDLSRIRGTGLGGRVTKRDLQNYLEQPKETFAPSAAPVPPPAAPQPQRIAPGGGFRPPLYEPREGDSVEPFSRRRRIIAEHMAYSKTHA